MSKLATALAQQGVTRAGPRCTVTTTIERLAGTPEGDELAEAIADPTIPATALSRALRSIGIELNMFPIARHRRGDCACSR